MELILDMEDEYINKYGIDITNDSNSGCVVISDDARAASKWPDYAVIGVEHKNSIYGVQYVVESVLDIDARLLYKAYCRKQRQPLDICETQQLLIREMCVNDINALIKLYEMSDVRYIKELSENEKTTQFIENYIHGMYEFYELGLWLAIDKESNEVIGRGGIEICEMAGRQYYELAYMIRNDYRQLGLGYELASAVLMQAGERGITEIIARIDEKNTPSIGLAQKLGFKLKDKNKDGERVLCIYELK